LPSIPSLLQEIPDEFKPLAALGIGAIILTLLAVFHGISLHQILVHFRRRQLRLQAGRPHLWGAGFLFGWAIFMMLSLHVAEIVLWSVALSRLGLIVKAADSFYFCANAYTTMGYGTVDLTTQWRNITPVIAISGLFTFAWTTSSLVALVQNYLKIVEQLEDERAKQLQMRAAARHAAWEVVTREKQAERDEKTAARQGSKALSFFERRKIWKEEKDKAQQLRLAAHDEMARIREQEGKEEDELGQGSSLDDSGAKK
jgi:hypothetical protein